MQLMYLPKENLCFTDEGLLNADTFERLDESQSSEHLIITAWVVRFPENSL